MQAFWKCCAQFESNILLNLFNHYFGLCNQFCLHERAPEENNENSKQPEKNPNDEEVIDDCEDDEDPKVNI